MRKGIFMLLLFAVVITALSFKTIGTEPKDEYVSIESINGNDESIFVEITEDYNDYKTWYRITEDEPNTGDPTGFLVGKHRGTNAYREVYINEIGEAVSKGTAPYKYPAGTMVVKEEYKNEAAWKEGVTPRIKLMVKLKEGESPETGDWGYSSKLNSKRVATGISGKAKFCTSCHIIVGKQGDYIFMNSDFLEAEKKKK